MRWALELVTGPEVEPVLLPELKRHLGEFADVTDRDDDATLAGKSAREVLEDWAGRALVDQTWRLTFGEGLPYQDSVADPRASFGTSLLSETTGTLIYLRRSPVLSIVSFVSIADDGTETAVDADAYELRDAGSKFPHLAAGSGVNWRLGRYRVTFRAGFADRDVSPPEDGSAVPACWRSAIKLQAEAIYHRDPAQVELLERTARNLLRYERAVLDFA